MTFLSSPRWLLNLGGRHGWHAAPAALLLALAFVAAIAAPSRAEEFRAGDIVVEQPWVRATPPNAPVAGGFLVARNAGAEADRLVGGTAEFASRVEIHEMAMDGEVMKMRRLPDGLELAPGSEVTLKPGSYHVMFIGLTRPLAEGETVRGTLTFAKAGTLAVEWHVMAKGAMATPGPMPSMSK